MSKKVIICEKMRFLWTEAELERVRSLHFEKKNVWEIAEAIDEEPENVALALFHLSWEGRLDEPTKSWI
jgi:hypothetical protein|nr:MAG TPA: hypothetical protein [Caudoviricetes sp.]